jgi:hypothetical protein
MEWDYDRAARIKAAMQEHKEQAKCAKFTEVSLTGSNMTKTGYAKSGKKVMFEGIQYGISEQGKYGAGTLSVLEDNGQWKVVFTKGYPSKALSWMMKN